MSLLDLLNKVKKDVIDKVADELVGKPAEAAAQEAAEAVAEAIGAEPAKPEHKPVEVIPGGVPSGFVIGGGSSTPPAPAFDSSWYEEVPSEECQYNFSGTYLEYFSKVFREDFPRYDVALETIEASRRYKYTFRFGGEVKLIVELMTEKSCANAFRRECLRNGIPYLRFYFDHEGWWNTRAYVDERVGEVLGE